MHIDLSETISEVKAKLQELVEKVTRCPCKQQQHRHLHCYDKCLLADVAWSRECWEWEGQTVASVVIQEPEDIKLYKDGTELPDSSTLAESKAENGDTIAMAFALPGGDL